MRAWSAEIRSRRPNSGCRASSVIIVAAARRIRTGNIHLNGVGPDFNAPFGGYRRSGNGREWGALGFDEYLETKAIMGYGA